MPIIVLLSLGELSERGREKRPTKGAWNTETELLSPKLWSPFNISLEEKEVLGILGKPLEQWFPNFSVHDNHCRAC